MLVARGLCSGSIHVDLCDAHGTWFDPGELEPLVVRILATKLDGEDRKVLDEMLDNRLDRFLDAIRNVMAGATKHEATKRE